MQSGKAGEHPGLLLPDMEQGSGMSCDLDEKMLEPKVMKAIFDWGRNTGSIFAQQTLIHSDSQTLRHSDAQTLRHSDPRT